MQAMHKLGEPTGLVRVRQVDLALAKALLEPARKQYTACYGEDAPSLSLDQRTFLPPPPASSASGDADDASSWCV